MMLTINRVVAVVVYLSVGLTTARLPDDINDGQSPEPTHSAGGWPNPEPMDGPIPNNNKPQTMDPTVIRREDGKLFLYHTAKNGSVWTADSLYGPWKHEGNAHLPEFGGAPSIHKVDDTYYMFYNNHEFDYRTIGIMNEAAQTWYHGANVRVASSKTLMPTEWTQHGRLEIDWAMRYNILDASLLTAGHGDHRRLLFTFGSYQRGIFQLPLADPPTKIAHGANDRITHLANNVTKAISGGPTEGAFVFKWKEYYYLFYSSGRCCVQPKTREWLGRGDVYKVMVCRSKDPRKGYVDDQGVDCANDSGGKEILGTHDNIWAPGGQGVMVDDEAGGPIIYYHYVPYDQETDTKQKAYHFGWNKLDFSSGWPVVI
ncbi:Uu.00g102100.m01.CDS01 [Anthostomella pinea]|uniref:Endo-1,5-alpha-L-arabinanase A n=1 Tax=Anthostomella pinea TaxID=933095 RepID=A0AAI8YFG8_9PEZI|nr:Uu.00g102100.m01.CDS01 [Anthostomella pinea]